MCTRKYVVGSMLDLIGGGSQQNASRSGTPAVGAHRKSPTADQGTQVCSMRILECDNCTMTKFGINKQARSPFLNFPHSDLNNLDYALKFQCKRK